MGFEDVNVLSDDEVVKTPEQAPEKKSESPKVESPKPKSAKPKGNSKSQKGEAKAKSKSAMKRPAAKVKDGQDQSEKDVVESEAEVKVKDEPDVKHSVMKRPAAKAGIKRPAAEATATKNERAYMCFYKRDEVYGIKWKGSEVMRVRGFCFFLHVQVWSFFLFKSLQVKSAKNVSAEKMREIAVPCCAVQLTTMIAPVACFTISIWLKVCSWGGCTHCFPRGKSETRSSDHGGVLSKTTFCPRRFVSMLLRFNNISLKELNVYVNVSAQDAMSAAATKAAEKGAAPPVGEEGGNVPDADADMAAEDPEEEAPVDDPPEPVDVE